MSIFRVCCFATVLFISAPLFGAKKGDIRVTSAFGDASNSFIVFRVEEYTEESFYDFGHQTRLVWSSQLGVGGLYWGNAIQGFVRVFDNFSSFSSSHKIAIFSPVDRSSRKTELKLNLLRSAASEASVSGHKSASMVVRPSELSLDISCDGSSYCLKSSEALRVFLNELTEQKKLKLKSVPNIRIIQHVLQFHDVNRYIIVDASRLDFAYEEVEISIWDKGRLLDVTATDVFRFRDGTKYIQLENGDLIIIPNRLDQNSKPRYRLKNSSEYLLTELSTKYINDDLIKSFGIPALKRFQIGSLKSVCELLVGDANYIF